MALVVEGRLAGAQKEGKLLGDKVLMHHQWMPYRDHFASRIGIDLLVAVRESVNNRSNSGHHLLSTKRVP